MAPYPRYCCPNARPRLKDARFEPCRVLLNRKIRDRGSELAGRRRTSRTTACRSAFSKGIQSAKWPRAELIRPVTSQVKGYPFEVELPVGLTVRASFLLTTSRAHTGESVKLNRRGGFPTWSCKMCSTDRRRCWVIDACGAGARATPRR